NNNYFNVELLTEGVYILRITQGDKMSTFKFIKE
ncbi:T9SS type A sorting domain-containing protein, partial [Aestuariivivens sp. NBU2969]